MQITIQKKFLILYEIAENVYAIFLVIVNFVFEFTAEGVEILKRSAENVVNKSKQKSERFEKSFNSFVEKTHNFIRALFGFNIYKLQVIKINNKNLNLNNYNNSIKHFNNQNNRVRYSNLLAPPYKF